MVIVLMTVAIVSAYEINANDIEPGVDSHSITYDHIRVKGDLVLDQLEYNSIKITNSIIEGNISVSNKPFEGDVYFINTTFCKNSIFFNSEFKGNVDLSKSQFLGDANFSQSIFYNGATFDDNTFDKKADFSASQFDKLGSFYNSTFKDNAIFDLAIFNGAYANFESANFCGNSSFAKSQFNTFFSCLDAEFLKDADFHGTNFVSGSNFTNAVFLGLSRFDRCLLNRDSRFRNTSFNNTIDFSSSRFDGPSYFNNDKFHGNAIFDSVQFLGPSDFSDAKFDKNLSMNNAKITAMVLDNATFSEKSRLFLARADINRFMVKWSMIKDILSYDSSAYLSLVKNYKDLGLSEGDDCYYQYRLLSQDLKIWSWSKIYDVLAEITCGYGVRPDRPVICSIILVIICASILYLRNGLRIPSNWDKKTSFFDSLYYCLAIFFTIPLPDLKPAGKYRYVPVILRALAWTLFALLIGTIGKVMIK